MLQQPTTNPQLGNPKTGETPAATAVLTWLNEEVTLVTIIGTYLFQVS
jgi:hypothetical protein